MGDKSISHYEVFEANITIDTQSKGYSSGFYACKGCQCACHLCRGHISPAQDLESLSQKESEKAFRQLLAAA